MGSQQVKKGSDPEAPDDDEALVPVVGVGASAGGLDAFRQLLNAVPTDTGCAFLLVQHLDPSHESLMAELLASSTRMPVVEAADGATIKPDHVYMIAPDGFLGLQRNALTIVPPVTVRGARLAVDHLFRSLAEERGHRAMGIVLSGTGSDGTAGLRAIKAKGGLALVQEPSTASHDGMPASAANSGVVDFVLPIEEMPDVIANFVENPVLQTASLEGEENDVDDPEDGVRQVLATLKHQTRFDAEAYKLKTVTRRIQRRMGLRSVDDMTGYEELLRSDQVEAERLKRDLMISVTEFFRNPEAFDVLERKVIPKLLEGKDPDGPLRVWVPGCATGEEPYSLAMIIMDALRRLDDRRDVHVFATDIDESALTVARAGRYPISVLESIPEARRARYFDIGNDTFTVKRFLRDKVSFSTQDLLSDPPFSRIDLVSCRNLMIYVRREVQRRVLGVFHFTLQPGGILFLGTSETPSGRAGLFETVSKTHRIYRRSGRSGANDLVFPATASLRGTADRPTEPRRQETPMVEMAEKCLAEAFLPPSVIVDRDYKILYLHGAVERFLHWPRGAMNTDLLSVLSPELRTRLRGAIYRAARESEPVEVIGAIDGGDVSEVAKVRVCVSPQRFADGEQVYAVSFEEYQHASRVGMSDDDSQVVDRTLREMEHELVRTQQDLRTTIEELETANEELKASNEESISMNEELQSSNEELEASSEELRSLNEELSTVNVQLKNKIEEVEVAHDDLRNLLVSTRLPTLFLDMELRLRRFTPDAGALLGVSERDMHESVARLDRVFPDDGLVQEAQKVLDNLSPVESEVSIGDSVFLRRVLPYRTEQNMIDGVVVIYHDITQVTRALERTRRSKRTQTMVANLGLDVLRRPTTELQPVFQKAVELLSDVLDIPYAKVLELRPEENRLLLRAGVGWKPGLVGEAMVGIESDSQAGYTLGQMEPIVVDDLRKEKRFSGPALLTEHGVVSGMSCTIETSSGHWGVLGVHTKKRRHFSVEEVSGLRAVANILAHHIDRALSDAALRRSESETRAREMQLELALAGANMGAWVWRLDTDEVEWDDRLRAMLGCPPNMQPTREAFFEHIVEEDVPIVDEAIAASLESDEEFRAEFRIVQDSGAVRWLESRGHVVDASESSRRMYGVNFDITLRKELERERELLSSRKDEFLAILGHELRNPLTALESATHVLTERKVDAEDRERMHRVLKNQVELMQRIVDDLTNLARAVRGKLDLEKAWVPMASLMDSVRMGQDVERAMQEIEVDIEPVDLLVWGDADRLTQAVANLVTNAIRHTSEDSRIRVHAERVGDGVVIDVADTGMGMSADQCEEIWEPFTQLARGKGGLGIGLTLVKRIVELHGGRASVTSEGIGKGCSFNLTIPDGPHPAEVGPKREKRVESGTMSGRILVVDDNVDAASSLAILLESYGPEVIVAHDGPEALDLFGRHGADIVIMDIALVEMTGVEAARQIRECKGGKDVLILGLTGFSDGAPRAELAVIADDVLTKPVDVARLLELIAQRLGGDSG